jgi:hypothetical protein
MRAAMRATASVVEPAKLSGTRCRSDDAECVAALHRSPEFFVRDVDSRERRAS